MPCTSWERSVRRVVACIFHLNKTVTSEMQARPDRQLRGTRIEDMTSVEIRNDYRQASEMLTIASRTVAYRHLNKRWKRVINDPE